MTHTRRLLWVGISVVVFCALLGGVYGSRLNLAGSDPDDSGMRANLQKFERVYNAVALHYATRLNPNSCIFGPSGSMTEGAIPGMLRTLDPHSNFFDPKAFRGLEDEQEGKYFGVGMYIQQRLDPSNKLVTVVVYPFHGSPAMRAGIHAGDVIVSVNGKSAEGLSIDKVAAMLKGPRGTVVHVSVSRVGIPSLLNFAVRRAEISRHSVETAFMVRPGIAYIRILNFDETTNKELSEALSRLGAAHFRGLILDLRGNPGGLLQEAVVVADHFLKRNQLIVYHYGRNSREERYYVVHGNGGHEYPMVVLIGPNTASAAEIVTGALQDHDRALIVGQPSFGKGLVQTVFPLSDGTGLALTTAHYYMPSGRLIQRDYSNLSLYDYFNHEGEPPPPHNQLYYTDGGRKVYGGGGITPDVLVTPPKLTAVQQELLGRSVFFNFGKEYLATHSNVPRSFQPDQKVLVQFLSFLKREDITLTATDLASNMNFIKQQIRESILGTAYGGQEADRVAVEDSPLVQKAIAEIPEAAELVINVKQYMASRREMEASAQKAIEGKP